MMCITGANGTVGSEVVRQAQAAGAPFRAAYHSRAKADAARAQGIEAVVIDYERTDTLRAAFRGCEKLFLLGPSAVNQRQLEENAVAAARAAGVQHVVKQSVLNAGGEAYAIARIHRAVESSLETSGLAWTFLRPNAFMQNFVTYLGATIRAESAFYSAAGSGKIAHVDVRDIAAVALLALTRPGHEGKAYELTGPEALSYDETAAELSRALGRPIRHVNLPPEDYRQGMLAEGVPAPLADLLVDLERLYREGGARGLSPDVRKVTGRELIAFARYARETAATGAWNAEAAQTAS